MTRTATGHAASGPGWGSSHAQRLHAAGHDGMTEPVYAVECSCGWTASPPHDLTVYPLHEAKRVHLAHTQAWTALRADGGASPSSPTNPRAIPLPDHAS